MASRTQTNKEQPKDNKPVKTIRCGVVSASIWRREYDDGVFYSVVLSRSYKPKDSEEWQYSDSLNRDDVLLAAKLLDMAHTWIIRQEQEDKKESRE
jgi:hypothetical protein